MLVPWLPHVRLSACHVRLAWAPAALAAILMAASGPAAPTEADYMPAAERNVAALPAIAAGTEARRLAHARPVVVISTTTLDPNRLEPGRFADWDSEPRPHR